MRPQRWSANLFLSFLALAGTATASSPIVLYTDITSGPNIGGENGDGIYLTVFGKDFGTGALGQDIKVLVNGVEVKRYFGTTPVASRGRPDIQQIATQIGLLGLPPAVAGTPPSSPLPVKVVVNGKVSNPDQALRPDPTFQVNPGNIYFVSPTGSDNGSTKSGGEFASPFRTVQKPGFGLGFSIQSASESGAYGRVRAGDFIVMREGTYTGVGFGGNGGEGYFMQALNKSGCPVGMRCEQGGGGSSGPITIMGYPGETAFIDRTNTGAPDRFGGALSAADSARAAQGYGAWWNVVNLKIENGFTDGSVNTQGEWRSPIGSYWRVVNNDLSNKSCGTSTKCRAGGVAGSGKGNFWVGNHIHDVEDKPDLLTSFENHGVYIDGPGSYEIAYNLIERIPGGNGIQLRSEGALDDVSIHHNIIREVGKHGLNVVDSSRRGIVIWNNVISRTASAGLRLGSDSLQGLKLYNNTFYLTGLAGDTPSSGALTNDMDPGPGQVDIRNNIFWPNKGSAYARGNGNTTFTGNIGIVSHNLWFGAGPVPPFSTDSVGADPRFEEADAGDFRLREASPAAAAGTDQVAEVVRDSFEIVAREEPAPAPAPASATPAATAAAAHRPAIGAYSNP